MGHAYPCTSIVTLRVSGFENRCVPTVFHAGSSGAGYRTSDAPHKTAWQLGSSCSVARCTPSGSRVGLFSVRMFEVWCKCTILYQSSRAVGASERSWQVVWLDESSNAIS